MDSSKIFGGAEECHSSESGWTMYIGSPIHGEDDDDRKSDDGESDDGAGGSEYNTHANHDDDDDDDDDDDSDDSMASDASSGPSYPYGNGEVRHRMAHSNHENQEHDSKRSADKKAKRHMEKHRSQGRRNNLEKEEVMISPARARTPAQSASKVRTNVWIGKRK